MSWIDWLTIFTAVTEGLCYVILMEGFFRRKLTHRGLFSLAVVMLPVGITVSNYFLEFSASNVIGMLGCAFVFSFLYDCKMGVRLLSLGFWFAVGVLIELLMALLLASVLAIPVQMVVDTPSYQLIGSMLSKVITLFVFLMLYRRVKNRAISLNHRQWLVTCLAFFAIAWVAYLLIRMTYALQNTQYNTMAFIGATGLLIIFFFVIDEYEKNQELLLMRSRMAFEENRYQENLAREEKMKQFKHDYTNQLIALRGYLAQEHLTAGLQHLQALEDVLHDIVPHIHTGNSGLDMLLSSKITAAEKLGVDTCYDVMLPAPLPVAEIDLCTIMGNALDNAIEACERLPAENRWLQFSLLYDYRHGFGAVLDCRVANSAPPPSDTGFATHKADTINHGRGLTIIRDTLRKYHTTPDVTWEDDVFTLHFTLMLQKETSSLKGN
ncbi:MAG: GHKL domain-containing protein [Peptococcaceae bacterium]|nr:GHKL domain-containing protein [Peptococcaceae bacterium]